ncbi:3'-5' exoribonuclease 1-like [Stegodyphus dumicola]|uniref:3'-5' exoribonuclease 1-like n=1 Tax=Stegodyphus dumicola TaxID=202533 RepID=UPI0015A84821|nr:3'-5' exoribonuclease 1-like [Stegodyphus dumicola]
MRMTAASNSELQNILQKLDTSYLLASKSVMRQRICDICTTDSSAAEYVLKRQMETRCSYNYICVIDFEATCINCSSKTFYPHEIIEFPAAIIDIKKLKIVDFFHSFVRPVLNPKLSDFCKNLTGISQEEVDSAESFTSVLISFSNWIKNYTMRGKTVILTDGTCDIGKFLVLQCLISQIDFPSWAVHHIDVKDIYQKAYKLEKSKLTDMLLSCGMDFEGRLHSGKDDTKNIARLAIAMLKDGAKFHAKIFSPGVQMKLFRNKVNAYKRTRAESSKTSKKSAKRKSASQAKTSQVESCNNASMDIDPDLKETEYILMKFKRL